MCIRFDVLNFSTNISYKFSIIKYDFEKTDDDEIDEQINDAIFVHLIVDFDVKIEKRDDFDATTEREIISIQNICFLDVVDVATDAINDCFDVINDVNENKIFEIIFDEITNDVKFNVDSFDEKNIANDIDNAIIAFDVSIDAMNVCFAIIAFDVLIDTTNDCFNVKKM